MPTQNEIERRAYQLYEQRGREDGHDRNELVARRSATAKI